MLRIRNRVLPDSRYLHGNIISSLIEAELPKMSHHPNVESYKYHFEVDRGCASQNVQKSAKDTTYYETF